MTWTNPQAWWLLVALPVVAGIFLYRRRIPVIAIPSLGPWRVIGVPIKVRDIWSLLRRLLVLALQLAIILAMVAVAVGPHLARKTTTAMFLVLDASATMQARTSGDQTRYDLALQSADQWLAGMGAETRVTVILAADVPLLPFVGLAPAQIRGDLRSTVPTDTDSRLDEAVALAGTLAGQMPSAEVIVISDFAGADPDVLLRTWHSSAPLRLVQVGDSSPDAGLISAAYGDDGGEVIITGQLAQHGLDGRPIEIHATRDGRILATTSVIPKGPVTSFRMQLQPERTPVPAGIVRLHLNLQDSLSLNNDFLIRTAVTQKRVAVIANGESPMAELVASAGGVQVVGIDSQKTGNLSGFDLVIFDRCQPVWQGPPPATGGFLFVGCVDPFGWVTSAGMAPGGTPTSWAPAHALLKDVQPEMLKAGPTFVIAGDRVGSLSSQMEVGSDPLLVELMPSAMQSSRAVYLLFDPYASSAAKSYSFPILIYNALDYLVPDDPFTRLFFCTGQSARISGDSGIRRIFAPDGTELPLVSTGRQLVIPRLAACGEYQCTGSKPRESFVVNYVSDRPAKPLPKVPVAPSASATQQTFHWSLPDPQILALYVLTVLVVTDLSLFVLGRIRIA